MPTPADTASYLTKYLEKRRARPEPPLPTCERLWTTPEVAAFLGVPVPTLHRWRYLGTGPEAFKVGRHLRYDPEAVRRWLVEHCQQSA